MHVKSFEYYINENKLYREVFYALLDNKSFASYDDKREIEKILLITENFFDTLKDRYTKAKEVASNLSNSAKEALEKIVNYSKDVTGFIISLKNKLKEFSKEILSTAVGKLKDKLSSNEKLMSKIKILDKKKISDELKQCKELVEFYKVKMINSLLDKVGSSTSNFLSTQPISEGTNNMISKLIIGLEKIPPFNWLHNLKEIGERGANQIFKSLGEFTNKLGGPHIEVPLIASVLGIAFEYNVKGFIKQGIISSTSFFAIPFITPIIICLSWIATFIATITLVDSVLELNILHH